MSGPTGRARPGVRSRIAIVVVALVALTAAVLGIGASLFVDASLRDRLLADARGQASYDLAVLIPGALPGGIDRASLTGSGVLDAFRLRGDMETIVDFGDGDPVLSSLDLIGALDRFPPDLRTIVDRGQIAYAWTAVAGRPVVVVAGRPAMAGAPAFYFVRDASAIDGALAQLRIALLVGALVLIGLALLAARGVARGILRPIDEAGRTAAEIAAGNLGARVPVTSNDEFGAWAREFNRMAAVQEETIERLREAEAGNRRFVADVAHELRTPLTALVAEASLLRDGLPALPPDARRAGELLVADVGRFRALVEDLMELSRFDAGAEVAAREPVDLAARLRALAAARLPAARVVAPDQPVVVETDPRRIDRIVGNLLDNAREHAPGAPVEIVLARGPGSVIISVADRGPGVPAADIDRLFDRFAKADPARPGGSGLGLAIAREHAALLGGTLRAGPRPGGGLLVEVALPVTESLPDGDLPAMEAGHDGDRPKPAPRLDR